MRSEKYAKTVIEITPEDSWVVARAENPRARRLYWYQDLIREIRSKVEELADAEFEAKEIAEAVCESCGAAWTEDSDQYNGGCCAADIDTICGFCDRPGADKAPNPVRWPGEESAGTKYVHSSCEDAETQRAHSLLTDEQRARFLRTVAGGS